MHTIPVLKEHGFILTDRWNIFISSTLNSWCIHLIINIDFFSVTLSLVMWLMICQIMIILYTRKICRYELRLISISCLKRRQCSLLWNTPWWVIRCSCIHRGEWWSLFGVCQIFHILLSSYPIVSSAYVFLIVGKSVARIKQWWLLILV